MQKYGIIENGELATSELKHDGYKPVEHAEVPEFDQITQAVIQGDIVDEGGIIKIGAIIINVTNVDGDNFYLI